MARTCETCRWRDADEEVECRCENGVWFGWIPANEQFCGEHRERDDD